MWRDFPAFQKCEWNEVINDILKREIGKGHIARGKEAVQPKGGTTWAKTQCILGTKESDNNKTGSAVRSTR